MPQTNSPITHVPIGTPMFNTQPDGTGIQGSGPRNAIAGQEQGIAQTANLGRSWILFFESLVQGLSGSTLNPIIGFVMNSGVTGTNVGPVLQAVRSGTATLLSVAVKAADASTDSTFDILQNGTSIFTTPPTIPAASAVTIDPDTLYGFDDFVTTPVTITEYDVFTINITSGTADWEFTAILLTAAPSPTAT